MGTIQVKKEDWVCGCGSQVIREHRKKYAGLSPDGTHLWVGRKERESDPRYNKIIDETSVSPLLWVGDPSWYSCEECGRDLDEEEIKIVNSIGKDFWEAFRRGEIALTEEVGECIINPMVLDKIRLKEEDGNG